VARRLTCPRRVRQGFQPDVIRAPAHGRSREYGVDGPTMRPSSGEMRRMPVRALRERRRPGGPRCDPARHRTGGEATAATTIPVHSASPSRLHPGRVAPRVQPGRLPVCAISRRLSRDKRDHFFAAPLNFASTARRGCRSPGFARTGRAPAPSGNPGRMPLLGSVVRSSPLSARTTFARFVAVAFAKSLPSLSLAGSTTERGTWGFRAGGDQHG
jgi:hypothetical protein